jgi:hypothetical protein
MNVGITLGNTKRPPNDIEGIDWENTYHEFVEIYENFYNKSVSSTYGGGDKKKKKKYYRKQQKDVWKNP